LLIFYANSFICRRLGEATVATVAHLTLVDGADVESLRQCGPTADHCPLMSSVPHV